MENIDSYISNVWNKTNKFEKIVEENIWDICRILEQRGLLVGDDAPISAISIGPFKVASTLDIKKKDMLAFFLEIIIPAIFSKASGLPFDQVYSLYLLPAANIFIELADHCCWVKDLLQWEILMFIKKENKNNNYPTCNQIKNSDDFRGIEFWQIDNAINELKFYENVLGDRCSLISVDFDGRMECLV